MADNYVITEGVGRTMAADDISGVLFPRIKIIYGADGVNDGDVSTANGFPVQIVKGLSVSSISAETNFDVTTSSQVVLASNASRKGGWVRNISDTIMYVSFSGTAATNKPTKLEPGESLSFKGFDDVVYTGAVSAIHAGSGNKVLEIVEK